MVEEISITRALSELKVLSKRLDKVTNATTFVGTKAAGQTWRDFTNESKNNWQKIVALQTRYENIKFAILESNSKVKVTVCGREMTIANAIALKDCFSQKEELLNVLKNQRCNVRNAVDAHEQKVQSDLDRHVSNMCKNQDGTKDESAVTSFVDGYRKNNKIDIVDSIDIDSKINALEKEIDDFKQNIDFVLSESNALTKISV